MREAYDWALFNKSAEPSIRVDHTAPIHDSFCRCRACKVPLVGEKTSRANRADAIGLLVIILAMIAIVMLWKVHAHG